MVVWPEKRSNWRSYPLFLLFFHFTLLCFWGKRPWKFCFWHLVEVCVLINRAALWVFPVFAVFTSSLLGPIYVCGLFTLFICFQSSLSLDSSGFPYPHITTTEKEAHGHRTQTPSLACQIIYFTNCTVSHWLLHVPGDADRWFSEWFQTYRILFLS